MREGTPVGGAVGMSVGGLVGSFVGLPHVGSTEDGQSKIWGLHLKFALLFILKFI